LTDCLIDSRSRWTLEERLTMEVKAMISHTLTPMSLPLQLQARNTFHCTHPLMGLLPVR